MLNKQQSKGKQYGEYVLGVDVARSMNSNNNQSSVAILEIQRNANNKIKNIDLVNLITITGTQNFEHQAVIIKKIKRQFNAKIVVVDCNGLGTGLCDCLVKENYDYTTGETMECWATINSDRMSDVENAEKCIYELNAQSAQNEIVVKFIDAVESHTLRLLEKRQDANYDLNDNENYQENILPFIQTDFLIDEILNLKIKHLSNGNLTLERVVGKMNKDRVSATIYGVWYIMKFMDNVIEQDERGDLDYLLSYLNY